MSSKQCELGSAAIVDAFKKRLATMHFIAPESHQDICTKLDNLCSEEFGRFEKALIAKELWRLFSERSLRALTDNTRGYGRLCHYYDDYVEYEDLLFAIDDHYRDHTIHVIWVMLLGLYMMSECEPFANLSYCIVQVVGKPNAAETQRELEDSVRPYEVPLWCLVALTHDLGYPLEKTRKANRKMLDMIAHFGVHRRQPLDYGFTTVHQTAISELLRILSLEVVCNGSNYEIREREGLRLDYGKNLESLHHGIASAFLLLQHLDWPCQTLTTRPGYFADKDDAIQALLLSTLLGTISSHTNMNWYTKVFNDMYTLLFLCDELEEFSRYARSPESHEWEEVRYRTQVEWTDRSMSMTFTLDNRNVTDFEHFWKDKVRKIHRHFECTAGAIEEISITGRDLTRAPAITYTYRHRQGSAPEIAGPNDCEGFVAELDLL